MGTDCAAFSFSDQQATSDGTHCKLCTLGFSTETSSALSRLYRTYRSSTDRRVHWPAVEHHEPAASTANPAACRRWRRLR